MSNRIVILGGGESGVGAAVLAKRRGMDVWLSDKGNISTRYKAILEDWEVPYESGMHTESKILNADWVIKSPGIPHKVPVVQAIAEKGITISSEIEFASRFTDATLVGITGSNGKTTTTSLTYHVLRQAGMNVGVAGNIGQSFAYQVATEDFDHYVLEISSFQLDDIQTFRPHIAVLLNITPDHLDRYGHELKQYADAKFAIGRYQQPEDHFLYCLEDELTMKWIGGHDLNAKQLGFGIGKHEGSIAWMETDNIQININQKSFTYDYTNMQLEGRHNIYNTMASAIVANILEIRKDAIRESFSDFRNIEHRLEKVAMVRGVEFINDSKATNVNSAWYALETTPAPIVWIAGGVDKGNDYSILAPLVERKVKSIVALGSDVRKLHEAFGRKVDAIINAQSMEECVKLAYHMADKGDSVLLSPACASFDMFDNYEDRGRQFKSYVRQL